jgi:hypothetical protein
VFGRRPVATSSSSTVIVSAPTCSCTASPAAATESSAASSRTSTPSVRSAAATRSPANGSSAASNAGPRCSSVTAEPSRRKAWASSQPTTPPPSTPSRRGISLVDVASREDQVRTVSSPGTGGRTGRLPVHSATARRAVSCSPSTVTVRVPVSRARPRRTVMPAPSAHSTWPESSQLCAMASRRVSTASGSNSALVPGSRRSAATACPVRSSALDGMQAQYEHSPPSSSASMIIAVSPPRAA